MSIGEALPILQPSDDDHQDTIVSFSNALRLTQERVASAISHLFIHEDEQVRQKLDSQMKAEASLNDSINKAKDFRRPVGTVYASSGFRMGEWQHCSID